MPLPHREMLPLSNEEKIIACADLFYSKKKLSLSTEKSLEKIKSNLAQFGAAKVAVFEAWMKEFSLLKGNLTIRNAKRYKKETVQ